MARKAQRPIEVAEVQGSILFFLQNLVPTMIFSQMYDQMEREQV